MRNRSFRASVLFVPTIVVIITVFCATSSAFPAQSRSLRLVDRFMRRNPLRALTHYFGRKLSLNMHHPPPRQQFLQPIKPQGIVLVSEAPLPFHYTKIPTYGQVYYGPAVAMIPPQHSQHAQLQPQLPKFVLHGVSYQVPFLPQQQQYQLPQLLPVVQTQPTAMVPTYSSPAIPQQSQLTNFQQSTQVQIAASPQSGVLVSEQHQVQQYLEPQFSSSAQFESSHHGNSQSSGSDNSDTSLVTLPTIVSSADEINEDIQSSDLLSLPQFPQLSDNVQMQIDGYEDANSGQDMMKIFVIRPKDMEKLRHSSEAEREELVKGYSTKYVDVEQGAQELVLSSSGNNEESRNEASSQQQESCIEPLCDPFLKKLIPELFSSGSFNRNGNDDPIVIVKNDSDSSFSEFSELLKNHRLDERTIPNEEEELQPLFTVVKSVEGLDEGSAVDILQGQQSTLSPQRVRVHFPRKKFLSAKINSTNLGKYEPKPSNEWTPSQYKDNRYYKWPSLKSGNHHDSNGTFASSQSVSDEPVHSLIPKPRKFETDTESYPYYRYGSSKMLKQRTVRDESKIHQNTQNDPSMSASKNSKMIHYTAGVLFNDSKVSKL